MAEPWGVVWDFIYWRPRRGNTLTDQRDMCGDGFVMTAASTFHTTANVRGRVLPDGVSLELACLSYFFLFVRPHPRTLTEPQFAPAAPFERTNAPC